MVDNPTPEGDAKTTTALNALMYQLDMVTVIEKVSTVLEELRDKVKPAAIVVGLFQIATEFIESNKGSAVADKFAQQLVDALMTAVNS